MGHYYMDDATVELIMQLEAALFILSGEYEEAHNITGRLQTGELYDSVEEQDSRNRIVSHPKRGAILAIARC